MKIAQNDSVPAMAPNQARVANEAGTHSRPFRWANRFLSDFGPYADSLATGAPARVSRPKAPDYRWRMGCCEADGT